MDVVVVESPAKARTINKYLGSDYMVVASFGHVRDLPSKDGSVAPEKDFEMLWEIDKKASPRLLEIKKALSKARKLILATDPDREGEAISWHIFEILREQGLLKNVEVERVTFNAITRQSVLTAMSAPRMIDQALVDAYLARRALDYLVGFRLSPLLWRKLPGARSAGRVQSVSLRLVCEREAQIENFKTQEYWSVTARLQTEKKASFDARLVYADEKIEKLTIKNAEQAEGYQRFLESATFQVKDTASSPVKRNPYAPFTTSTLQQEASRKLGFSPATTMRLAQSLYEGLDVGDGENVGLITYMRTDGVQISPEGVNQIRAYVGKTYAKTYLPEKPRLHVTKSKNSQEAHEAIRPTDVARSPETIKGRLEKDTYALYDLIWKRTVASQMSHAEMERTTVNIQALNGAEQYQLRAVGQVVRFDGFLSLYNESRDDEEKEDDARLPFMQEGERLVREKITPVRHVTEPPPRFSEASLIKQMETLGIGRPSTYASTLAVLRDRGYVRLDKKRLFPEEKGRLVTSFLEGMFTRYVEYDFTADLENRLDSISAGRADWRSFLHEFWTDFEKNLTEVGKMRTSEVIDVLNDSLSEHLFPKTEEGVDPRLCDRCGVGRMSLKLSRTGPFIGCSDYPTCRNVRSFSREGGQQDSMEDVDLGQDPGTGLTVTLKSGRFGPYVQLGEGEKPKRASLPKTWAIANVDLEKALVLLSLPRDVGTHPETGEMIKAGIGRYGPYVQHKGAFVNLDSIDEAFTVGINRAVDLIAEKESKGGRGRKPAGTVVGEHPEGGEITRHEGRYGPYVKWGKINATIPSGELSDLSQAISLLDAKRSKSPDTKSKSSDTKKTKKPKK